METMDPKKLRELMELMKEYGLSEIELEEGKSKLHLRKQVAAGTIIKETVHSGGLNPAPVNTNVVATGSALDASGEIPSLSTLPANAKTILSPMVGTFYKKPAPDKAAFVKVGDIVDEDTVVCIIEAMKVMNEIKAECSGRIVEIKVADAEAVEFEQVLIVLEPV
jgi:acetyl-CoA carboxylase biotin carboxyl carrier protein